jgi:hypothetical protein
MREKSGMGIHLSGKCLKAPQIPWNTSAPNRKLLDIFFDHLVER